MTNVYAKGKKVGEIKNRIFRKKIQFSKHLMHAFNAVGIDEEVFANDIYGICTEIRILDTESGGIYSTTPEMFDSKGIRKEFGSHGKQIFLPLKYWKHEANIYKQDTKEDNS